MKHFRITVTGRGNGPGAVSIRSGKKGQGHTMWSCDWSGNRGLDAAHDQALLWVSVHHPEATQHTQEGAG